MDKRLCFLKWRQSVRSATRQASEWTASQADERTSDCMHRFCTACIERLENSDCPMCRKDISCLVSKYRPVLCSMFDNPVQFVGRCDEGADGLRRQGLYKVYATEEPDRRLCRGAIRRRAAARQLAVLLRDARLQVPRARRDFQFSRRA